MGTYIISSHGEPVYTSKTAIPKRVSVRFYQPFGTPMKNEVGFALQSALTNPLHPKAATVIQAYPQRALWNGKTADTDPDRQEKPEINLTGDTAHDFYSGIVHAESGNVIHVIPAKETSLLTLSGALAIIRKHADKNEGAAAEAVVHCLFCL